MSYAYCRTHAWKGRSVNPNPVILLLIYVYNSLSSDPFRLFTHPYCLQLALPRENSLLGRFLQPYSLDLSAEGQEADIREEREHAEPSRPNYLLLGKLTRECTAWQWGLQPICLQFRFAFFSAMCDCGKCLQGLSWSKINRRERKETARELVHTTGVNI